MSSDRSREALLASYYRDLLPVRLLVEMITRNGNVPIQRRQIVHIIKKQVPDGDGKDVWFDTYKCFESAKHWSDYMLLDRSKPPLRFELGPLFNCPLTQHAESKERGTLEVAGTELRFDIDLTDYDDVRFCCSDKAVCKLCWRLAIVAAQVLKWRLVDELDLHHLLWVFSGRRGLHCWVLDQTAFDYSKQRRAEIVELVDGEAARLAKGGLASEVLQAHADELWVHFDAFVEEQGIATDRARAEKLLGTLPLPAAIRQRWLDCKQRSGESLRKLFVLHEDRRQLKTYPHLLLAVMLRAIYPRIDKNVTRNPVHLLKGPFSVHQATQRVCMPLAEHEIATFDPNSNSLHVGAITPQQMQDRCQVLADALPWRTASQKQ